MPDLAPVLGDVGEPQSAGQSVMQLQWEGNNFVLRAKHHCLFVGVLVGFVPFLP